MAYSINKKRESSSTQRSNKSILEKYSSKKILADVQGNIFESHRREFVSCLFFHFGDKPDPIAIRDSLSLFADNITSAASLHEEILPYRNQIKKGKFNPRKRLALREKWMPICCLYLTSVGFDKFMDQSSPKYPEDKIFRSGMKSHTNGYWDNIEQYYSLKNMWIKFNSERKIDLMILIADNDPEIIATKTEEVKKFFKNTCDAEFLFCEDGKRLYQDKKNKLDPREAFGFRDGISNIPFWTSNKLHLLKKNREIVLDANLGSYLVYKKLEQDVPKFDQIIIKLTEELFSLNPQDTYFGKKKAFVEAQVFGRFKDGTPLALFGEPILENKKASKRDIKRIKDFNNYNPVRPKDRKEIGKRYEPQAIYFNTDPNGIKCPYFAHIRKTNPREKGFIFNEGDTYTSKGADHNFNIRIARRGIPYSEPSEAGEKGKKVGMLFMGYQSSISNQFVKMQRKWVNDFHFPTKNNLVGVDPIIGKKGLKNPSKWIKNWCTHDSQIIPTDFSDIVNFIGGEYFYAPSIPCLRDFHKLTKTSKQAK